MLINISCLVQIIQNNAGHSALEWHPQAAAAAALRRVSCGQSAWQPKVNAPSLCLSASQALGCVCVCVRVSAVSIFVLICHFSSFMSIWICCSAKRWPWNFHATTNSPSLCLSLSPAGVFAEMWWLLVVQIEIPVLTQFCLSSGREREWKLRNWAEKCESQFCLTTKNVAAMQGEKTERERDKREGDREMGRALSCLSRFAKICSTYYAQLASSE